jgi:hypothetical protein
VSDLIFADSLSRLGTESAFVVLARAQKLASEGRDIINLASGNDRNAGAYCRSGIKALLTAIMAIPGRYAMRKAVADLNAAMARINPDNVAVAWRETDVLHRDV